MDLIKQTKELLNTFGVSLSIIGQDYNETDLGNEIRDYLFADFDYKESINNMDKHYADNAIYLLKDMLELNYISFRLPKSIDNHKFINIGPYITNEVNEVIKVVKKNNKDLDIDDAKLKEYYQSFPYIKEPNIFEAIVIIQAKYIFNTKEEMQIIHVANLAERRKLFIRKKEDKEKSVSNKNIEENYNLEYEMLNGIKEGNVEKVLIFQNKLSQLSGVKENVGLRERKNKTLTLNTLFRKAAQQAGVNPVLIDELSNNFANQIEDCENANGLLELSSVMSEEYCDLVRKHSLKTYSEIIRQAITYIDFHIQEQLTLNDLARKINVNATYLSGQFKKEVGVTITDYINKNKISNSLLLIAATDMPISKIAEMFGFLDENYFSRVFKKYQGMSAIQYRNAMRSS